MSSSLQDLVPDLLQVAFESRVMDSLQFLENAWDYRYHASIHVNALRQVKKANVAETRDIHKLLFESGQVDFPRQTRITGQPTYFGLDNDWDVACDIISRAYFQSLHSMLDSYAQFLNRIVLGNDASSIDNVSFNGFINRLGQKVSTPGLN